MNKNTQRIEKGTGSTVLNLAVFSYGTVREFKIAQRVDITRLVTIIVQYSSNDFDENQKFFELGNTLPISSEKHYETSQREHLKQVGYYVGKHTTWILKHTTWILKQLYYSTKRSILKKLGLVSNPNPTLFLSSSGDEPCSPGQWNTTSRATPHPRG